LPKLINDTIPSNPQVIIHLLLGFNTALIIFEQ